MQAINILIAIVMLYCLVELVAYYLLWRRKSFIFRQYYTLVKWDIIINIVVLVGGVVWFVS